MKIVTADTAELQARIEGEKREKFLAFYALLTEYNAKFNLTAVTEEREVFVKHFLDSALGERFFPAGAKAAEVGSGAGFPSLPIRILRDDLTFTLFESVGKKCDFLRVVCEKLGLDGVTVVCMRAEDAGRGEYREAFDCCCARAVARLNTLAEYCLPLVRPGGGFVAYKGEIAAELNEGAAAIATLGGRAETALRFSLPGGMGERTVLYVKKERPTPKKYPRGNGRERRDPIV